MPPRAKPPGVRRFVSAHAKEELRRGARRGRQRPTKEMTSWRRFSRPVLVRKLVSATESLRWSPALIKASLLEETLHGRRHREVTGHCGEEIAVPKISTVAMALILRHSWRADDLAAILERLGSKRYRPYLDTAVGGRRHGFGNQGTSMRSARRHLRSSPTPGAQQRPTSWRVPRQFSDAARRPHDIMTSHVGADGSTCSLA